MSEEDIYLQNGIFRWSQSIKPILGAMYIGTIHPYCKFLLGEMDAHYKQYEDA